MRYNCATSHGELEVLVGCSKHLYFLCFGYSSAVDFTV